MTSQPGCQTPPLMGRVVAIAEFILLLIVPIVFALNLFLNVTREDERARAKALEETLDREIRVFFFKNSPREILFRNFETLFAFLEKRDFQGGDLQRVRNVFPRIMPVQIGVFDLEGRLRPLSWGRVSSRNVFQKLWDELVENQIQSRYSNLFRSAFGQSFVPRILLFYQGCPVELGNDSSSFLMWKRGPRKSGMIIYLPSCPSTVDLASSRIRRYKVSGFLGMYNPKNRQWSRGKGFWNNWRTTLSKGIRLGLESINTDGHFCRILRHPEGFWVFRARRVPPTDRGRKPETLGALGLLCLLGILIRLWQQGGFLIDSFRISSRIRMIFLCVVAVPAALLGHVGMGFFREAKEVLERDVQERNLDCLRNLDFRYGKWEDRLLSLFRACRNHPRLRNGIPEEFADIIRPLAREELIAMGDIRDINSSKIEGFQGSPRIDHLLKLFFKNATERYLGIKRVSMGGVEALGQAVARSSKIGINEIYDRPDALNFVSLGRTPLVWYWDFFPPSPGKPVSSIFLSQHGPANIKAFLRAQKLEGMTVFNQESWSWFPETPGSDIPKAMVSQSLQRLLPVHQVCHENRRPILITAYPSMRIPGLCFVTRTEIASVLLKISRLKWALWFLCLTTVLLALLFSSIVSGSILAPVSILSQGVSRLGRKEFQHPLPSLGKDELGRLGEAFNDMLGNLKELNLGRAIQESLIPLEPPRIPGFEIALHFSPASDLGGDFVEVLHRPDGKYLFGIVDVTGHGIPSAILTAMTKTAFFLSAKENQPLHVLLDRLNLLVNQALRKKRLMTLFVGILDPISGILEWASVGHPYPLLRTGDGPVQELGKPCRPMGISLATKWAPERALIPPDSTLILYTDGIVEGSDRSGLPFGYDRLRVPISTQVKRSAKGIMGSLLRDFEAHSQGVVPEDDVTILVLHRTHSLPG